MTTQSKALRLADALECGSEPDFQQCALAAYELRRLHAANQELLETLKSIASMYDYEASCGDLASLLYEAKCLANGVISKLTGSEA